MIKLENSDKAVKGLARIISQNPTFPILIKQFQEELIEQNSMKNDKKYIDEQNKILKEAGNLASTTIAYIFKINREKNYMAYVKRDNQLIPISKKFERSSIENMSFKEILKYLQENNFKQLITFDRNNTANYFYTHPSPREKEEWESYGEYKQSFIGHSSYHNVAEFNEKQKALIKKANINFQRLNEDESKTFVKNLKQNTFTDRLKPF